MRLDQKRHLVDSGILGRHLVGAIHLQPDSKGCLLHHYNQHCGYDYKNDKLNRNDLKHISVSDKFERIRVAGQGSSLGNTKRDSSQHHLHAQGHQHGRNLEFCHDHAIDQPYQHADQHADQHCHQNMGYACLPFFSMGIHVHGHEDGCQIRGCDDRQVDASHQHRQHHRHREQSYLRNLLHDG